MRPLRWPLQDPRVHYLRIDEGFVPLDVDDDGGFGMPGGHLRDAVRSGGMIGPGHFPARAEGFDRPGNSFIIGGNQNIRNPDGPAGPFIGMQHQRFPAQGRQHFFGDTGRSQPGGYDAQYAVPALLIHEWQLRVRSVMKVR